MSAWALLLVLILPQSGLTQDLAGEYYNYDYYEAYYDYGDSSVAICRSSSHIEKVEVCTGYKVCQNKTDDWDYCKDRQRSGEVCPDGFARCNSNNDLKIRRDRDESRFAFGEALGTNSLAKGEVGIPGQCIGRNQIEDNIYTCLDRSDEDPFTFTVDTPINFTKLEACVDKDGDSGLYCGDIIKQD